MNRFTLPTAARISAIESDNYRTKTFVLDARLDAVPGQFVMAWLPRFDEKPFSLVNADPVTLMITAVGPFTRLVHELQVGDRLWLRGPFGSGFHVAATQRRLALVGGGYGVAPLLWLARTQLGRAEAITPILGARTAEDLLYAKRFEALIQSSPLAPRPSPLLTPRPSPLAPSYPSPLAPPYHRRRQPRPARSRHRRAGAAAGTRRSRRHLRLRAAWHAGRAGAARPAA